MNQSIVVAESSSIFNVTKFRLPFDFFIIFSVDNLVKNLLIKSIDFIKCKMSPLE